MTVQKNAAMGKPQLLTANGSKDTLINQPDQEYNGTTIAEIAKLVDDPQAKPKADAAFVIPSTYRKHDGRSHAAQRERGEYWMLAIDVDEGNPTADLIDYALTGIIGDATRLIYTSSGATADNMKWRVLIPLKTPLTGAEYVDAQLALFDLMDAEFGIKCDTALSRTGQPIFLPNVPADKRDADGQPNFYIGTKHRGSGMIDAKDSRIWANVEFRAKQAEIAERKAAQEREARQARRDENRSQRGDDVDPVDEFNQRHSIADLLLKYGYEQQGRSDSYRSPQQSSGSYATKDFGTHWVSLSGSDAGAGLGQAKDGICWGDAFDLFCFYEHSGDMKVAVRSYANELRPDALMGVKRDLPPPSDDLDDFDYIPNEISSEPANPLTPADDADRPFFAFDSKGNIVFNHHNVMEILTKNEEWRNVFAFDEFAQRKMVMERIPGKKGNFSPREIRDADYIDTLRWFNLNGFLRASKNTICDAVDAACIESIISPVKHWLERMGDQAEANPQPREYLDTWAIAMLGVEPQSDDHAEYIYEVSRKWLIGAVARALSPGCKADAVLILEGSQGAGKSTALRLLAGDEWFGDALPPMGTKDASDYLRGKWIVELAELSNINKAEVEIVKAFVSRTEERFRPAYGRSEICYPRQCIFAGTTNKSDYLRDETGNRRFWPIKCGKINTDMIQREREMIWGEAVRAYRSGEKWWLSEHAESHARNEQEKRLSVDEWTSIVENYCAHKDEVAISQIAFEALSIEPKDINRQNQNRISTILSTIGFARDGKFSSGDLRNKARFVREIDNEE